MTTSDRDGADFAPKDPAAEGGTDNGTGDPNADRAFLMDQAPAQVDADAVAEHSDEASEG